MKNSVLRHPTDNLHFCEMNLRQFFPDRDDWYQAYIDEMGRDSFLRYYNRVFLRLMDMKPGDKLMVLKEVSPDNYKLFIRCAVMAVNELASYDIYSFDFEQGATVIERH